MKEEKDQKPKSVILQIQNVKGVAKINKVGGKENG